MTDADLVREMIAVIGEHAALLEDMEDMIEALEAELAIALRTGGVDRNETYRARRSDMSGSVNKATLLGNLGRKPEMRTMQSGDKVATLSVATSERWRDKEGNQQERTEWHRVVIFGRLAEVAEQYLHKGSKVYLEGAIQTRKWAGDDGRDRFMTEVVLRPYRGALLMLDGKQRTDAAPPADSRDDPGAARAANDARPESDELDELTDGWGGVS